MSRTVSISPNMVKGQNDQIKRAFQTEKGRLFGFIKSRVSDIEEAEDILQDVFYQLIEAYRLMKPVERLTAWLFTVARNKIIDRSRKMTPEPFSNTKIAESNESDEVLNFADILPDLGNDPEAAYFRELLWRELETALDELPEKQREVFVMHELEGFSFNEIATKTGYPINTLLSRKRYAIMFLREHLRGLYNELFNQ